MVVQSNLRSFRESYLGVLKLLYTLSYTTPTFFLTEHFSDSFGGENRAFECEKWSIKVEHFSGELKS